MTELRRRGQRCKLRWNGDCENQMDNQDCQQ